MPSHIEHVSTLATRNAPRAPMNSVRIPSFIPFIDVTVLGLIQPSSTNMSQFVGRNAIGVGSRRSRCGNIKRAEQVILYQRLPVEENVIDNITLFNLASAPATPILDVCTFA